MKVYIVVDGNVAPGSGDSFSIVGVYGSESDAKAKEREVLSKGWKGKYDSGNTYSFNYVDVREYDVLT